ncbi:GNAT family N-acetyltransferase [Streptomyces sp. NPDC058620]|uniref:GNAT family N-acetyltransferase n=1 Tax=Streptomyces sp. NPDC058620 TaxID=3346560 RepID=UPI00365F443F
MVELREFAAADVPLLMAWIAGPTELLTWAGPAFTWPLDESQLAEYAAESATDRRRSWMGLETDSGRVVGHASLRIDAAVSSGRLGRVLVAPQARGRGYGTALLEPVLTAAFEELRLDRVELGVFDHNESAVRLYERLGFVVDRVLPDVERVDGRPWSALQMVLEKSAWGRTAAG